MVKHERDMLGSILDLEEVPVGDIMVHRRNMVLLDADLPPHEIVQQVLASPHTRIPVWRGEPENVIGVLHAKDLLRRSEEHTSELQVTNAHLVCRLLLEKKKHPYSIARVVEYKHTPL